LNRPLQRLAPIFRAADLVMVNCEGVLSDHARQVGSNRTPEKYGKVIVYAPSNVLRGRYAQAWDDGYLARFTLGPKAVEKVELLPIDRGQPEGQPAQPTLMQGATARQLLENLRNRSAALDTPMAIDGEKGVIAVSQTNKST
jgi:hypothetical protein